MTDPERTDEEFHDFSRVEGVNKRFAFVIYARPNVLQYDESREAPFEPPAGLSDWHNL
ncbi:hypothetical protein [Saliphagus infecundisoli]|uniref:Uncharacterized protein n=1 Tax=Saliphagus infecundisoli TaxID=1849069 RepID=A0ABD5QJ72_9EURY|nr:hypothetical protein [Saliphagus infecundisoli]